ncbi:MAG: thiolase, partial [Acidimicrobiia bacterium]
MATSALRGKAAIVGVADAVSSTGQLDTRGRELETAMMAEALADAGLTVADVDGICHAGPSLFSSMAFAEHVDIRPVFTDSTNTGGSSFEVHAEHAAAAINAGVCDVVLSVYAGTPRGDRSRNLPPGGLPAMPPGDPGPQWETPYGLRPPIGPYALAASRHM